jgi:putative colanic acid biosynthesis acetyltransferase WcaF
MGVLAVQALPTLGNKAARVLWLVVWTLLFRPSPTPLFWWRRLLLRLFGAEVGAGAHPYPSARIWAPWNLVMKARSCLAAGVDCYCVDRIVLGRDAVISQRAFLCTASHDHLSPGFHLVTAPITIGEGAWVAAEAYIGPGVTLGARAVAGARAVVVRDVPAGGVVVGNPARLIARKEENTSAALPIPRVKTR